MRIELACALLWLAAPAAAAESVRFSADGAAVRLVADVNDVDIGPDDHLELWLALPGEGALHEAVVRDDVGRLLRVDGRADPGALARELEAPRATVSCDGRVVERDAVAIAGALYPEHGLRRLATGRARHGLVRLALFADGRPAALLDRPAYAALEQAAGVKLGAVAAGVSAKVTRGDGGWHLEARLLPDAFGFVPRDGLTRFRAALLAVDGAPRAAALPPALEDVTLESAVAVPLVGGYPAIGQPGAPALFPATWMRAARGWVGLERRTAPLTADDNGCRVELAHVVETRFVTTSVHLARSRREGRATVRSFRAVRAGEPTTLVVADGGAGADVPLIFDVFALPDGTPAVVGARTRFAGNPDGFCGAGPIYELVLWRLDGSPAQPLGTLDGCRGEALLAGEELPRLVDADLAPSAVLSWKTRGRLLTVTLPVLREEDGEEQARRFVVGWDEHGENVVLRR